MRTVVGIDDVEGIVSSGNVDKVLSNWPGVPLIGVRSEATANGDIDGSIGSTVTGRWGEGIGSNNGGRI